MDSQESRIAVISIIIEDTASVAPLNALLHEYSSYIIGRMGIPYRERSIHIVSLAMDAPVGVTSALTGRIGRLPGVNARTAFAGKKT